MNAAMPKDAWLLRLYVAGDSPNSVIAVRNLREVIKKFPRAQVRLELVDVLLEPERGLRDGVLVTPTLVKVQPAPERRIIGTLKDNSALLAGLGLAEGEVE